VRRAYNRGIPASSDNPLAHPMTTPDHTKRFIDLETRLAFQEHALQEMSDVVARQQAEIDRLTRALGETQDLLRRTSSPVGERSDEPPPPHY
jgi:SlyX protein